MAMVNIPSTCNDRQYRYKMPRLVSKKESSGNGSKTCIVNMGEVARALKRPPQYVTKLFGIELCAQSTYTCKEGERQRAIVNGHHDTHVFQTLLDKFIEKYVLCSNCHLPEIDMYVKRKMIVAKCKACGWAGALDNAHRLAAFITKNPPDDTGLNIANQAEAGGGKLDKKARREVKAKLKEGKKDKDSDEEEDNDDDDDDDASEKATRNDKKGKKEKTEKKERKEKKEKKERKKKDEGEEEEEDEHGEKTEKKEKKDKKEKKEKKEKNEMKEMKDMKETKKEKDSRSDGESDDSGKKRGDDKMEFDDEDLKDVVNSMRALLEDKNANPSQFFEELRMHQLALCFDNKTRLYVALESLCGSALDSKAINDKRKYISLVISIGKMDAAAILCSFGMFIHMNKAAAKSYAMVMKAIYDADWAEEKDILNYYNEDAGDKDPGFYAAKDGAGPFLKWLETAESDDDDDDEEDKDEDSDED